MLDNVTYPPIDENSISAVLTTEERLAVIEAKLDYIIAFVDKTDKTFGEMAAMVEGNPMLKMLMG
jgi:hypothetical protein